jgi:hypothetical protein
VNEPLLDVLRDAQDGLDRGSDAERRLLDALAHATLLVPVARDAESGRTGLSAGADADGATLLYAFTDEDALRAWFGTADVETEAVPGHRLAALAAPTGATALVVNPAGPYGGRLERDRVELVAERGALLERPDGTLVATGEPLGVVAPRDPAPALVEALRGAAAAPGVEEAWLVDVVAPGPPRPMVVVVTADDGAIEGVGAAAAAALPPGAPLDLVPVAPADWAAGQMAEARTGLALHER